MLEGMVNVTRTRCGHEGCGTEAHVGTEGGKMPVYCRRDALDDVVDITNKRCEHKRCDKRAGFAPEGSRAPAYCRGHALDGMVMVTGRRCAQEGDSRRTIPGPGERSFPTNDARGTPEVLAMNPNEHGTHENCRWLEVEDP